MTSAASASATATPTTSAPSGTSASSTPSVAPSIPAGVDPYESVCDLLPMAAAQRILGATVEGHRTGAFGPGARQCDQQFTVASSPLPEEVIITVEPASAGLFVGQEVGKAKSPNGNPFIKAPAPGLGADAAVLTSLGGGKYRDVVLIIWGDSKGRVYRLAVNSWNRNDPTIKDRALAWAQEVYKAVG